MAPRRLTFLSLAVALLAVVIQAWPHVVAIQRDEYPGGAAWEPRVKAILDVSRVAARGGPYLTVPVGQAFEPADRRVNDLGFSALGYAWGRALGRPLHRRMLMAINLAILLAALLALFAAMPPWARLCAAVTLCLVPIPVPRYLSPDPLATHASLLLLGIVLASSVLKRWPLWCYPLLGLVLFGIHKVRSAYALYAAAAVLALALVGAARERGRAPLVRAALLLTILVPLEWLWRQPLQARARDPRVTQLETLWTHNVYVVLLEGIGYSENRWGIKPSDPWVATYIAERLGLEPVDVGTAESERRSRIVYFGLLREDPLHLLGVYASRLPTVARDHAFGGLPGAFLLIAAVPAALAGSWRRPPREQALLLAASALMLGVLFQAVVLDTRLIYAYPLRTATSLTLALACALLLERRLRGSPEATAPSGTPPRSP